MTRKEICGRCLKIAVEKYMLVPRDDSNYSCQAPWPTEAIRLSEYQVELGRCYRTNKEDVPSHCEYQLELIMAEET